GSTATWSGTRSPPSTRCWARWPTTAGPPKPTPRLRAARPPTPASTSPARAPANAARPLPPPPRPPPAAGASRSHRPPTPPPDSHPQAAPQQIPHPPLTDVVVGVQRVRRGTRVDVLGDGTLRRRFFPFRAFTGRVQVVQMDVNGDGLLDVIAHATINGKKRT